MKKYLLGIFAIVLAIGFSSFTVNNSKKTPQNEVTFRWHQYNAAGTAELFPVVMVEGDEAFARQQFECPDGSLKICARAYDLDDNPTPILINKP